MKDVSGYYQDFFDYAATVLPEFESIQKTVEQNFANITCHGDFAQWQQAVDRLPDLLDTKVILDNDSVTIDATVTKEQTAQLKTSLMQLHPWRKGPFTVAGIYIDSEWKGEYKWNRIKNHLDVRNKKVLDVGAANGYYSWRIAGAGACLVVGIDPTIQFVMQFHLINKLIKNHMVSVVPLRMEQLPANMHAFDIVFSMGVLYHRVDPVQHLRDLLGALVEKGEVILETMVVDDSFGELLVINDRYAKMPNVFEIPSCGLLEQWFGEAGFSDYKMLDVSQTSLAEQRSTEWMRFHSLEQFLDPEDYDKTIEGLPAPKRALYLLRA